MLETPGKDEFMGGSPEERWETLFFMAKNYDEVGVKEINPSLHALKQVTQRYQSAELIAEGGMKQIFKVYDARAQRQLALAMMRTDASEDLCDPFIHEAWLTARLDHPNIITINDVGVKEPGRPYFTMDLKQGDSLRELVKKLRSNDRKTLTNYPLEELLQIFLKVCDAMAYAHSVNVVHLDLKPANIQIGDYGQVLVCDWGLGKVLGGNDPQEIDRMLFNPDLLGSVNLHGQLKGTLGYMAPEQLVEDGPVDARTDVYGLGGILYTLLTLLCPLTGDDEDIMKQTRDGAIASPIQRMPEREISKSLNAVAMKALETEPSKRYASVDALRKEIQRYLTGFATQTENAGVFKQLNLFYRRNRRFCLAVFCLLLVIVVGTVWAFRQLGEKEQLADEARQDAEHTLALYEAGQSELEKMSFENSESVVKIAERYQFSGDYERAEAILRVVLENDPGNEVCLRAQGVHYFILQQFHEAAQLLERGNLENDNVCQTAQFYAAIKADSEEMLSAEQLIDILYRIQLHETLALRMVLYDQRKRFDLSERARIIEAYLRIINPDWLDGWFKYDEEKNHLRVGGKGLRFLALQQSVLIGLNLRTLDLSGSEVEDLWKETRSAIETLDIRGTPMGKTWFLKRFVYLRELITTPGQLTEKQLKQLSERVTVVEKSLD